MAVRDMLIEPELRGIDIESPERIEAHREILARKPLIRDVFEDFYRMCRELDEEHFGPGVGLRVEIGAGVSMFRDYYPDVLMTDVVAAEHLDGVVDAQDMPYGDGSVRAVYGMNCFHHIPQPRLFFGELTRVLRPGGGSVLIEPYYGPVAARLYKRLHATEGFDPEVREWEQSDQVMNGANQALSYNVFVRDRAIFDREFPGLEIVLHRPLTNYARYLFSGGLNFRALVPNAAGKALKLMEKGLSPLSRIVGLHYVIVIRKRLLQPGQPA